MGRVGCSLVFCLGNLTCPVHCPTTPSTALPPPFLPNVPNVLYHWLPALAYGSFHGCAPGIYSHAGIRTMPMMEMEKEKESSISLYYTAPSLTDHIILILGLPKLLIMILWYCWSYSHGVGSKIKGYAYIQTVFINHSLQNPLTICTSWQGSEQGPLPIQSTTTSSLIGVKSASC